MPLRQREEIQGNAVATLAPCPVRVCRRAYVYAIHAQRTHGSGGRNSGAVGSNSRRSGCHPSCRPNSEARMGNNVEACGFLERAATLVPDNPFVHSNLSCVWRDIGRTDAAIAAAERALAIDSRMSDAHNILANALKDQGSVRQAVTHYREAVFLAPENPVSENCLRWRFNRSRRA